MSENWNYIYQSARAINSRDQLWAGLGAVVLPAVALYGAYLAATQTGDEIQGPPWVAPAIFAVAAVLLALKYGWRFYLSRTRPTEVIHGQVVYKPSRFKSMTGFSRRGSSTSVHVEVQSANILTAEGPGDEIPDRVGRREVRCKRTIWSELQVGQVVSMIILPHGTAAAYGVDGVFRRAPTLGDLFSQRGGGLS